VLGEFNAEAVKGRFMQARDEALYNQTRTQLHVFELCHYIGLKVFLVCFHRID
jgi:hypothetical protein